MFKCKQHTPNISDSQSVRTPMKAEMNATAYLFFIKWLQSKMLTETYLKEYLPKEQPTRAR